MAAECWYAAALVASPTFVVGIEAITDPRAHQHCTLEEVKAQNTKEAH